MPRSARLLLPFALSAVLPVGALAQFGTSPPQPPAAEGAEGPPAPDDLAPMLAQAKRDIG